jgi:spoIIIJ-associated protein
VQDAIALALQDLNVEMEEAEIVVLDEGSKGLFGLGGKSARVRVTIAGNRADDAKVFLEDILSKMNVDVDVNAEEDEEAVNITINGQDSGIIIGRRGETLDAIQYLTGLVVNKGREDYKRVTLDIENYRQKREETLVSLANRLADRVVRYRKNVTLEPMNPYERRIIHSSLQNNKMVETYSVGEEPNRKVVIALKQNSGNRRQNQQ